MDGRLKLILLAVILIHGGHAVIGDSARDKAPPPDPELAEVVKPVQTTDASQADLPIIREDMVFIPPGQFVQGPARAGSMNAPNVS